MAKIEVTNLQAPRTIGVSRTFTATYSIAGLTVVRHTREGVAYYYELCADCDGTGYRPGYEFIDEGRCWPCSYTGLSGKPATAEGIARRVKARATREAKREAARLAKVAAARAEHTAWYAALPAEARTAIEAVVAATSNPFLYEYQGGELEEAGYTTRTVTLAWQASDHVRSTGEVAEVVREYNRRIAQAAKAAASTWMAAEGAKVTFTGRVVYVRAIEGYYGTTTLVKFEDVATGQVATWFASGFKDINRDEVVRVTGTVKKLEESDKYGKQTVLTRCKLADA